MPIGYRRWHTVTITVEPGKRYRAMLSFGMFNPKRFATNEQIAQTFRELGFVDVYVTGDGRERTATGLWAGARMTAELPSEIDEVTEYSGATVNA